MSVPDPFPDGVAAIPVATCGSFGEAIVSARALQDRVASAGASCFARLGLSLAYSQSADYIWHAPIEERTALLAAEEPADK